MLTMIFSIMMIAVFARLFVFAAKAAWGIIKVVLTLVFLPGLLVVLALSGLMAAAMPILAIVGLISLIGPARIRA